MHIKVIKADGFKNLKNVLINPHPKFNLITGLNAQGKTNLLEGIWLMSGCKSFRGSKDKDFVGIDTDIMALAMNFEDKRREQNITYIMNKKSAAEKDVRLNGVKMKGTKDIFDAFKAIVFTPDDLDLINGSPEKRRNFIDLCCSQININDMDLFKRYVLIIKNRNAVLKNIASGTQKKTDTDVWDQQASAIGTLLCQKRYKYIQNLDKICSELYSTITSEKEKLTIKYNSNIFDNVINMDNFGNDSVLKYYEKLTQNIDDDIHLGYTYYGAHRDDIIIKINGLNVRDFGSQGQKKTAALVMKLGQAEIFYKNSLEAPVILLDDVMGELDKNRQRLVFSIIKDMQVFITACNENSVRDLSDGSIFRVENGSVI